MSAISKKVRVALYNKLNVSGVTTLATGGVHHKQAPDDAELPYVVFNRQADAKIWGFNFTEIAESDLWLIKAYANEDSDTTKEPHALIEDILIAAETAVGHTMTISGGTVMEVKRLNDVDLPTETDNEPYTEAGGFLLRIVAS